MYTSLLLNKMHILHVTNNYKPSWESGGVVRVVYELSLALKNRSHEVTIYTTDYGKKRLIVPKNIKTRLDGIDVCYFQNISNYLASKNIITPYLILFFIKRDIKKFEIIHLHEHRSLFAIFVFYYAKKFGVPYVIQAHGSLPNTIGKSKVKRWYDLIIGKKILKGATFLLALNKTEAVDYEGLGVNPDAVRIIPNGIKLSEHNNLIKRNGFKERFSIPFDQKIILYVGRLDPTKGIDLLIHSFTNILTEIKKVSLVIIGGGKEEAIYKKLVTSLNLEEKVVFTGFISEKDKMAAYIDADVFVTPSFTGFPMTFLEACLCGTPIVTTDKGDYLEWIDGEVGFVVNYDKTHIKDAVLRILRDTNLRRQFSNKGQELIQTKFNWNYIVREIEEIYDLCGVSCNN